MPRRPYIFVFPPLEVSKIQASFYGEAEDQWKTLARVVAMNVQRSSSGQSAVILRPDVEPKLAVSGWFSESEAEHIRMAISWFASALSRLQYVDYTQVESDCVRLGEQLRGHLSDETLETASFVGIPRGGTIVLGLLSYVLDLDHSQVNPPESDTGPLVVVDDCFLSGSRLARFLEDTPSPSKIFAAGLYAHPDLRSAVERERPRIQACMTARDLTDHAPSIYGEDYGAWKRRWENRETEPRYWTGLSDHLCFPWSEPDYGFWNTETGQTEQAWRVVPPKRCLKTRFGTSADADVSVQVQHSASSAISLPSEAFYASYEDRVLVGRSEPGECLELCGTAADFWEALLNCATIPEAQAALQKAYDVEAGQLTADLKTFVESLVDRQLLKEESLDAFHS